MVWVAAHEEGRENGLAVGSTQQAVSDKGTGAQQREAVCRAGNAVRVLASLNMLIFPASILDVCKVTTLTTASLFQGWMSMAYMADLPDFGLTKQVSSDMGIDAKSMLRPDFVSKILQDEAQRRLQDAL